MNFFAPPAHGGPSSPFGPLAWPLVATIILSMALDAVGGLMIAGAWFWDPELLHDGPVTLFSLGGIPRAVAGLVHWFAALLWCAWQFQATRALDPASGTVAWLWWASFLAYQFLSRALAVPMVLADGLAISVASSVRLALVLMIAGELLGTAAAALAIVLIRRVSRAQASWSLETPPSP